MEKKKNFTLWGGVAVLGLGLVLVIFFAKPVGYVEQTDGPATGPDVVQSFTPMPDSTISTSSEQASSPQATPRPVPSTTEEPFSGPNGIKSPATCQVSGEA